MLIDFAKRTNVIAVALKRVAIKSRQSDFIATPSSILIHYFLSDASTVTVVEAPLRVTKRSFVC
jgi:hypothetical protein